MALPTVKVIVLGGTITMAPTSQGGISPTLTGKDLLSQIPSLQNIADIVVQTPFLKPGASLQMHEIAGLVKDIARAGAPACKGTVIVQGTDTIDETSFLAGLLYGDEAPIVVTGAMRGATALSADGPANLYAAVSTAASDEARNLGTLVVLNDEIHSAHSVEKMHKGLTWAFQSPNGGPLGYVLEDKVRVIRRPFIRPGQPLRPTSFPPVAIIKIGLGDTTALLQTLPALGYAGAVIEAMGAGHVPADFAQALENLSKTMPVVLASRVMGGPIFTNTYGFAGSEIDLIEKGLIPAGWLSPHKARLLLCASLGCGLGRADIKSAFLTYGQP